MDYKSARLIGASGKLQKNKGVMFVSTSAGQNCTLGFKGLSGGNWVDSTALLTSATGQLCIIVPVQVYGVTLGSGSVFELN